MHLSKQLFKLIADFKGVGEKDVYLCWCRKQCDVRLDFRTLAQAQEKVDAIADRFYLSESEDLPPKLFRVTYTPDLASLCTAIFNSTECFVIYTYDGHGVVYKVFDPRSLEKVLDPSEHLEVVLPLIFDRNQNTLTISEISSAKLDAKVNRARMTKSPGSFGHSVGDALGKLLNLPFLSKAESITDLFGYSSQLKKVPKRYTVSVF